ncbi:MAG: dipeptide ABC transporter ATP-binding protein [Lachnospiraceae bacterium]|nr:dipeptide ABC transporter ATP-binding protein [Lachnospiraceae bacterium]MDO5550611.1 dipeptide ABC transporter ATP-binding protein [Lachnospiraceae bacterium]
MSTENLLQVTGLKKYYPAGSDLFGRNKRYVKAVDGINLTIRRGETLGLVGESGCGKSTFGKSVLRLIEPTEGQVIFEGQDILKLPPSQMREMRKRMQIVFQDPYSSLNPRMTVFETVRAPLDAFGIGTKKEREKKVMELMEYVGLSPYQMHRYPHEFSGGQRQRMIIARALVLEPSFIVCDEPVSALDVSIRSQVLNLMQDIQQERGLTYLFISHDLSVVKHISDQVAVMYLGRIVECASRSQLFSNPQHPYTQALMSAIPIPDTERKRKRMVLTGDVPSPLAPPSGCHFHTRCPYAAARCAEEAPDLQETEPGHWTSCHLCGKLKQKEGTR